MNSTIKTNELVVALKPTRVINDYLLSDVSVEGFSLDSRTIRKGECYVALKGKNFDGNDFIEEAMNKGASMIITSRGNVSSPIVPLVIVQDTLSALGKIASFMRTSSKANVVGVTGSVGKTTTKEMLYHIVREKRSVVRNEANENNIIGVSKTLCKIAGGTDICITEMGSNKYGEIAELTQITEPDIGVITEVGPSHLEGFYRLERVLEEKKSILRSSRTIGVVNFDNPFLKNSYYANQLIRFGTDKSCDLRGHHLYSNTHESYFLINEKFPLRLKTPAYFNLHNALAAIGSSLLFGFSLKEATQSLSDFEFPAMRMEVLEKNGYYFINDTYNANPISFTSGLKVIRDLPYPEKIGVFGDMLELGENSLHYHANVVDEAMNVGFKHLFFIGSLMHMVGKELLKNPQWTGRVYFFGKDYQDIAQALKLVAKEGALIFIKGSHAFSLGKILDYF